MSSTEIALCVEIAHQYFGEAVGQIAAYLLREMCPRPLFMIFRNVSVSTNDVKKALRLTIAHNLCTYVTGPRNLTEYRMRCENVFSHLFAPKCTKTVGEKYGTMSQLLLEFIVMNGCMSMSSCIWELILHLHRKTNEDFPIRKVIEIKECFENLVTKKVLCRCSYPCGQARNMTPIERFTIPEIKLHLLEKIRKNDPEGALRVDRDLARQHGASDEPPQKVPKAVNTSGQDQTKGENSTKASEEEDDDENRVFPDDHILWRINFEKAAQYMRNVMLLQSIEKSIDKKASEIVRVILTICENTTILESPYTRSVSLETIWDSMKREVNMTIDELDPYLEILTEPRHDILIQTDDRAGGMYMVNIKGILRKLVEENASNVVQERFGSKSKRIFRIILDKKYIEQKKMEELAMISPKDSKEYTYQLIKENFITTQEIAKTPDCAPSRTIYLFHVQLNQVSMMLLQRCYQAAANLIHHNEALLKEHKRLIHKKRRVDILIESVSKIGASHEQIAEMEEMMTIPEQTTLEKMKEFQQKLTVGLEEASDNAFLYKLYIHVLAKST